ncbi:MAG TPA: DUF4186 domain-containing protein [Tepidisphaeraceae bacterium]|jgi:hypothetical protein
MPKMRDLDELFAALARSRFRSRFALNRKDRAYLQNKGMPAIVTHAADFIEKRLAPARPANDGQQTPWHGHPVFVAQHATGTCCRGCLAKWHSIPKDVELTEIQKAYVSRVLERWLINYAPPTDPQLFPGPSHVE